MNYAIPFGRLATATASAAAPSFDWSDPKNLVVKNPNGTVARVVSADRVSDRVHVTLDAMVNTDSGNYSKGMTMVFDALTGRHRYSKAKLERSFNWGYIYELFCDKHGSVVDTTPIPKEGDVYVIFSTGMGLFYSLETGLCRHLEEDPGLRLKRKPSTTLGELLSAKQRPAPAPTPTPALRSTPPFFLVWNPKGPRSPSFRHGTRKSAEMEAQRLSQQNPGQEFYVLAPVARATTAKPVTPKTEMITLA